MAKAFNLWWIFALLIKHTERAQGYQRPPKPGLDVCAKPVLQFGLHHETDRDSDVFSSFIARSISPSMK